MPKLIIACPTMLFLSFVLFASFAASKELIPTSNTQRDKVPQKFQWNVSDIFQNVDKWETAYDETMKDISDLSQYKGRLSKSAKILNECLKKSVELAQAADRIYGYAQYRYAGDESSPGPKCLRPNTSKRFRS